MMLLIGWIFEVKTHFAWRVVKSKLIIIHYCCILQCRATYRILKWMDECGRGRMMLTGENRQVLRESPAHWHMSNKIRRGLSIICLELWVKSHKTVAQQVSPKVILCDTLTLLYLGALSDCPYRLSLLSAVVRSVCTQNVYIVELDWWGTLSGLDTTEVFAWRKFRMSRTPDHGSSFHIYFIFSPLQCCCPPPPLLVL
jgi:hypothetical protein